MHLGKIGNNSKKGALKCHNGTIQQIKLGTINSYWYALAPIP